MCVSVVVCLGVAPFGCLCGYVFVSVFVCLCVCVRECECDAFMSMVLEI